MMKTKTLKKINNKSLMQSNHTQRKKCIGGKVIGSGGYGCIFKPALKCKNKQNKKGDLAQGTGDLTKLMTLSHANSEYNEINKYKDKLMSIPNYKDYFLIDDIFLCEPEKLSKEDLKHYKSKCTALPKKGITNKNINNSLDKVLALNMPDGGIDIGDYLQLNKKEEDFIEINIALIDLLNNGIVPMNNKNIYHCDIKESNVLVKPKVQSVKEKEKQENSDELHELNARLIDWGLSTEYIQGGAIPKVITNRPFQYNVPFSIVLFNPRLEELYDDLLREHPNPEYFLIRGFAIDFVLIWLKERGIGHFKVINEFIKCMFSNDSSELFKTQNPHDEYMSDYVYTYYYITNYLTEILYKYTINGELNLFKYFNDVFIKNIDLWGFIMTYSPILEDFYNNYKKLNDYELKVFDKLKRIIIVFLFETSTSPINVDELTTELKELNILFNECKDKHSMRLQSSTISMTPSIFTNTSVS